MAIHLELVNSLTAEYCVAAIRRFLARRGLPSVLWSDNAKTFVAARQKLNQLLVDLCPRWNYIVPRSPMWKGSHSANTLSLNSLVLIREDGCPRMTWPLGLVVQTYPGKD